MRRSDDLLRERMLAAMRDLWASGCPIPSPRWEDKLVDVGRRRWQSSARRGVPRDDMDARVRDLTKGLVEHLDPNPKLVGPLVRDYECVARALAAILRDHDEHGSDAP